MSLFSFNGQPEHDSQVSNLVVRNNLAAKSITATNFNITLLNVELLFADIFEADTVVCDTLQFTKDPTVDFVITCADAEGDAVWAQGGTGTGDVVGPASSTTAALAAWNDTTGELLKNTGITTASGNTVLNFPSDGTLLQVGGASLLRINTVDANAFLGRGAGLAACTASVAVGDGALAVSTGTDNVAVGYQALAATVTGDDNVVVGANSATNAPGIDSCIIVGANSGDACTGSDNIGFGVGVLTATTGAQNVAIGNGAMASTTSGAGNVAIGHDAFGMNVTGSNNVVIGNGAHNVAVETSNSVVIGASARVISGDNAVAIGSGAQAAANSIAIGVDAVASGTNSIAIGQGITNSVDDSILISSEGGAQTLFVTALPTVSGTALDYLSGSVPIGGQIGPTASSKRFKEDWKDLEYDENLVKGLQPVTFKFKDSKFESFGLLAEDVLQVAPRLVTFNQEGQPESVRYQMLSVYLLKEIQQLRQYVAELEGL